MKHPTAIGHTLNLAEMKTTRVPSYPTHLGRFPAPTEGHFLIAQILNVHCVCHLLLCHPLLAVDLGPRDLALGDHVQERREDEVEQDQQEQEEREEGHPLITSQL